MVILMLWEQSAAKTSADSSHEVLHLTAEAPVSCVHPYQSNYGLWTRLKFFPELKVLSFEDFVTEKCHNESSCATIFIPNFTELRNC